MTGLLKPDDLRSLTGAARDGAQEAWLGREPDFSAIDWSDDDDEEGIEGLLILPTSAVLPVGELPTGLCEPVGGVYALFSANGALNYVGQSCEIGLRIDQHRRAALRGERQPFTGYAYVEVCAFLVDAVEMAHILALRPPENMQLRPARWEYHEEAVGILRAAWGEKR